MTTINNAPSSSPGLPSLTELLCTKSNAPSLLTSHEKGRDLQKVSLCQTTYPGWPITTLESQPTDVAPGEQTSLGVVQAVRLSFVSLMHHAYTDRLFTQLQRRPALSAAGKFETFRRNATPVDPPDRAHFLSTSGEKTNVGEPQGGDGPAKDDVGAHRGIKRRRGQKPGQESKAEKENESVIGASGFVTRLTVKKPSSTTHDVDEPLNLAPATKRKAAWTPPRPQGRTAMEDKQSPSGVKHPCLSSAETKTRMDQRLRQIREQYLHKDDLGPGSVAQCSQAGTVLGKTKPLELFQHRSEDGTPYISANASCQTGKKKAAEKRARTITDLATATFRRPDEVAYNPGESGGIDAKASLDPIAGGHEIVSQPKHRRERLFPGTKRNKPTVKPRQAKGRSPLLSPLAATRQSFHQDFLFGTSSQLAVNISPQALRQQQATFQSSSAGDEDPFASSPLQPSTVPGGMEVGRNSLWHAGARNALGSLDMIERCDVDKEACTKATAPPKSRSRILERHESRIVQHPIVLLLSSSPITTNSRSPFFTTQQSLSQPERRTASEHKCSTDPPPSNQEHNELMTVASRRFSEHTSDGQRGSSRPQYELFTDAQLAKEVSRYGFKRIKRRTAMLALLNECWSGSQARIPGIARPRSTAAGVEPDTHAGEEPGSLEKAKPPPPRRKPAKVKCASADKAGLAKRPRGRPRRSAEGLIPPTGSTPGIADQVMGVNHSHSGSVDIVRPLSPPSISRDHSVSLAPADVSLSEDTELSPAPSADQGQDQTHVFVTKAVLSASGTIDPHTPSWYEKMLMYDPIVLEDFTAWLNAGQLDRVGCDSEVSPHEVKRWCEMRSICCLWKVNIRGKERKRL
jgi:hypothetical protein